MVVKLGQVNVLIIEIIRIFFEIRMVKKLVSTYEILFFIFFYS